jgi:hypothetical protein
MIVIVILQHFSGCNMGGENSKYIEADIPVYQQLTFLPKEIRNFFTKNPPMRHNVENPPFCNNVENSQFSTTPKSSIFSHSLSDHFVFVQHLQNPPFCQKKHFKICYLA